MGVNCQGCLVLPLAWHTGLRGHLMLLRPAAAPMALQAAPMTPAQIAAARKDKQGAVDRLLVARPAPCSACLCPVLFTCAEALL